jgi:hypothetical protein
MKYGVGNQHYISAQEISTMNGSPSPQQYQTLKIPHLSKNERKFSTVRKRPSMSIKF